MLQLLNKKKKHLLYILGVLLGVTSTTAVALEDKESLSDLQNNVDVKIVTEAFASHDADSGYGDSIGGGSPTGGGGSIGDEFF